MIAFARDLHTVLPTVSMQNYFRPAEPARGEDEAPVKLGKRKKDPGHFWTGLLTLVSGSLGMNPVFKCMSCDPFNSRKKTRLWILYRCITLTLTLTLRGFSL